MGSGRAVSCLDSLSVDFYRRPCEEVAVDLLGRYIVRCVGGSRLIAQIVETEAYLGEGDRASHAWNGRVTQRNASLFKAGGYAYVFMIYGIHCCFNAVTGAAGEGTAVLIRAARPIAGETEMTSRRGLSRSPRAGELTGGPGKLCQALEIDRRHDGWSLRGAELRIAAGDPAGAERVAVGPRVGIDYAGEAVDWPLRFAVRGDRHVTKPWLR